MKNILIALALAAPLTFASVGSAAPSKSAKKTTATKTTVTKTTATKKMSKCAKARANGKACKITFGIQDVKGDRVGSTGTDIMAKLRARFGGLIKFRTHFNDKVIKAADGI